MRWLLWVVGALLVIIVARTVFDRLVPEDSCLDHGGAWDYKLKVCNTG